MKRDETGFENNNYITFVSKCHARTPGPHDTSHIHPSKVKYDFPATCGARVKVFAVVTCINEYTFYNTRSLVLCSCQT